jgi:hypothetical protein
MALLIPQDNATRWNSWFTMVKVACIEAPEMELLNEENDLEYGATVGVLLPRCLLPTRAIPVERHPGPWHLVRLLSMLELRAASYELFPL